MRRWITACLAGLMIIGAAVPVRAAQPWELVDGQFIASDGRAIDGALEKGVSISKYQNRAGEINWKKLISQDITFAMIRLGDTDEKDPFFDTNIKNAQAHGIKVGIIFYTKALTKEKAEEEARYVLDQIKGYKVAFPVALEVESEYMAGKGLTKQQILDITNAFCKVIADAGYSPVIYGDYETLTKEIDSTKIPYNVWYVRYGVGNRFAHRTLWQCTDSAKVDGIKGFVCLEFCFVDYDKLFQGTGWRSINNQWYYYEDYSMVKSTSMDIGGKVYWFDGDGHIIAA